MRVTATHIERWADSRDAQAQLPLLVRRLIQTSTHTKALAMPTGDSVGEPGWDGITDADVGNAWVPGGSARWELSCDTRLQSKASDDFAKRVFHTKVEEMAGATFVFVTPRRWRQRHSWRSMAEQTAPWRGVCVVDADDLEAWLESSPAVTLWFAELLGLSGSGIQSVEAFWQRWRGQSRFLLTADALFTDREAAVRRFDELITGPVAVVAIQADSQEEAVAFACARLVALGLSDEAACVSGVDGWRFVDSNPALRVAIASTSEVAAARAPKADFTLVLPLKTGDRSDGPVGSALSQTHAVAQAIQLERASFEAFARELVKLGEEESDAARLARTTGRSWSIYRRVCARNPAIRQPGWLGISSLCVLSTLTLVGSWNSRKGGDRGCVETISGQPYESLEAELRALLLVDDSPVLRIGSVWRAKSPLELLHLCAPLITTDALDRFFSIAEAILAKPDPMLELEEEKRWMASVYGKVREESGIVIDAIVDSLVKLSVYAERRPSDSAPDILARVVALVHRLLQDANTERWLSLAGVLRELAEAAPDAFLSALESSLSRADCPVRNLILESSNSGVLGRSWHSGLLWALEILAWSPNRLHRVASILARLSSTPVPANWGNTPAASLESFFRPAWPQTMATSDRRLAVLDRLIRDHSEVAWSLLIGLLPGGPRGIIANAAPNWREDDAGKADLLGKIDLWYLSEIGARAIAQAEGNAKRIAALVSSLDRFSGRYQDSIVRLVETSAAFDDEGRIAVRDSLCTYLGWHNSYNIEGDRKSRAIAERLRPAFDALAPHHPVKRNLWLFGANWITLPDGREEDFERHAEQVTLERARAFEEVFGNLGWPGVTQLANECSAPDLVGREIGRAALTLDEIAAWLMERRDSVGWARVDLVLRSLLSGLSDERRSGLLKRMIAKLKESSAGTAIVELLMNAPFHADTWKLLKKLNAATQNLYWETVTPGHCRLNSIDATFAVNNLGKARRPRTAYQVVIFEPALIDATVLKELLEGIRSGHEPDGPLPEGWHIGKAISVMTAAGTVSRRDLAMLEFAYFQALEHTEHGTKNLYAELLSDPSLFMECICLAYRPKSGESTPVDDSLTAARDCAWRVLHAGRGIPGTTADSDIDDGAFKLWIRTVRELAVENDRVAVTDITVGEWLSNCNPPADGSWPPSLIADLLDGDEGGDVRRGFYTGLLNNRGVTSRAYAEGGAQERVLGRQYRECAAVIADRYPRVAEMLNAVAKHYEYHGRREDDDASLRREGL